jgi:hypothetical protein
MNGAKHGWRSYWRRRALRKQDRWILPLLRDYRESLIADRGGPDNVTAAELSMIELAQVARGCTLLLMAEVSRDGIAPVRKVRTLPQTSPGS